MGRRGHGGEKGTLGLRGFLIPCPPHVDSVVREWGLGSMGCRKELSSLRIGVRSVGGRWQPGFLYLSGMGRCCMSLGRLAQTLGDSTAGYG